ncbi:MAG: hypothetical protein AAGC45_14685, partial [Bacteroidota bacterium]
GDKPTPSITRLSCPWRKELSSIYKKTAAPEKCNGFKTNLTNSNLTIVNPISMPELCREK